MSKWCQSEIFGRSSAWQNSKLAHIWQTSHLSICHMTWSISSVPSESVCTCAHASAMCVCIPGVYCVSGGQLSGCWGRIRQWGGQAAPDGFLIVLIQQVTVLGSAFAAAPYKPGFPLLLPPLTLFQLPSAYLTSSLSVSPSHLTLPVFPEKQQEANEAWLAFIQPSIPLCVWCVCVYSCLCVVSPGRIY